MKAVRSKLASLVEPDHSNKQSCEIVTEPVFRLFSNLIIAHLQLSLNIKRKMVEGVFGFIFK